MSERNPREPFIDAPLAEPLPTSGQTLSVTTTRSRSDRASWVSTHLRNIIALSLTGMVCYLAWTGNDQAQAALIATFTVLAGALWGERSSLKIPGQDS